MSDEPDDKTVRRIAAKLGAPMPPMKGAPAPGARVQFEYVMGGGVYHIMKIVGGKREHLQTVSSLSSAYDICRRLREAEAAK